MSTNRVTHLAEPEDGRMFDEEITGGCVAWRMNLLAVSKLDPTSIFIAVKDTVYNFTLNLLSFKCHHLRKKYSLKDTNSSQFNPNSVWDKSFNHIKCELLGLDEVLVAVDGFGRVAVWFTQDDNRAPLRFQLADSAWGIAVQSEHLLLAVSCNAFTMTVWDVRDDEQRSKLPLLDLKDESLHTSMRVFKGHTHNVPAVALDRTGRFAASASIDCTCRLWKLNTGECIHVIELQEWMWQLDFVPFSSFDAQHKSGVPSEPCSYLRLLCTSKDNIYLVQIFSNDDPIKITRAAQVVGPHIFAEDFQRINMLVILQNLPIALAVNQSGQVAILNLKIEHVLQEPNSHGKHFNFSNPDTEHNTIDLVGKGRKMALAPCIELVDRIPFFNEITTGSPILGIVCTESMQKHTQNHSFGYDLVYSPSARIYVIYLDGSTVAFEVTRHSFH